MGRFDTNVGLDDFITSLSAIDIEYVAPHALEESAPIVKTRLTEHAEEHKRTGQMARSIQAKKAEKDKKTGGWKLFVGPQGTDRNGVRNMEKMAYLEFGVRAHKQPPTPVITPTVRECRDKVCDSMQNTFNRYLDALKL